MNVVPLPLIMQMMDQRFNSAMYVSLASLRNRTADVVGRQIVLV